MHMYDYLGAAGIQVTNIQVPSHLLLCPVEVLGVIVNSVSCGEEIKKCILLTNADDSEVSIRLM